jgi:ribonucleotide reductase beta subunit family protein with ferritin-like domain
MSNKLLTPNPHKYVVFAEDINPEVVALCDIQESNIWLASDINLMHDASDWSKLNSQEQFYLKQILAFLLPLMGLLEKI